MPRYFFHSEDGDAYIDPDGLDLPDDRTALREATRYLAELLGEAVDAFWRSRKFKVTVTDDSGRVVGALFLTGAEGG